MVALRAASHLITAAHTSSALRARASPPPPTAVVDGAPHVSMPAAPCAPRAERGVLLPLAVAVRKGADTGRGVVRAERGVPRALSTGQLTALGLMRLHPAERSMGVMLTDSCAPRLLAFARLPPPPPIACAMAKCRPTKHGFSDGNVSGGGGAGRRGVPAPSSLPLLVVVVAAAATGALADRFS